MAPRIRNDSDDDIEQQPDCLSLQVTTLEQSTSQGIIVYCYVAREGKKTTLHKYSNSKLNLNVNLNLEFYIQDYSKF